MIRASIPGSGHELRTELPRGERLNEHLREMFDSGPELVDVFLAELLARGFEVMLSPAAAVRHVAPPTESEERMSHGDR